jgi:hypothetical protein
VAESLGSCLSSIPGTGPTLLLELASFFPGDVGRIGFVLGRSGRVRSVVPCREELGSFFRDVAGRLALSGIGGAGLDGSP